MQFTHALAALAASSVASALSIQSSGYLAVTADVDALATAGAALSTITQLLSAINGTSASTAAAIQDKFENFVEAFQDFGNDTETQGKAFTAAQAAKLVTALNKTQVAFKKTTTQLSKAASKAKKSHVKDDIHDQLESAKTAITDAGKAFVAKVPKSQQASANAVIHAYNADINVALNAYGGSDSGSGSGSQ